MPVANKPSSLKLRTKGVISRMPDRQRKHQPTKAIDEQDEFSGDESPAETPSELRSDLKQAIIHDLPDMEMESLRLQSTIDRKRDVDQENFSVSFGLGPASNTRILDRGGAADRSKNIKKVKGPVETAIPAARHSHLQ